MPKYDDLLGIESGAAFLNVDLHIHTFGGSADVDDRQMTPAGIVESARRQNLAVIAITDHNNDVNVAPTIEYAQQHGADLLVLAGVEVTTAHGHLLVYFPPDRQSELARFLAKIDLVGDKGQQTTHTTKSMADTIAEADHLRGIAMAAHIDRPRTGFEALAQGYPNWKHDILASRGLYGLECDSSDALKWYSQLDLGSDGAERKKLITARRAVTGLEARPQLAHLQGSDAHSLADFERPDRRLTRMKLTELSFSAVRLALIDPEARVRARSTLPQSFPRVTGIIFTGGFLHDERIRFSDNMNCFIGGRGTGKSTAIRAIAYALGNNEEFGGYANCPDSVSVYCEDDAGVLYRYRRVRGKDIEVFAKEDASITNVPLDSFRIEYFGQGELAEVAKDPFNTPDLFQAFLDRHARLRDLDEAEHACLSQLRENAARLAPLEASAATLTDKKKALEEIERKLKVAEEGDLRGLASAQSKTASEIAVRASVEDIAKDYTAGISLSAYTRSFPGIKATVGECTDDPESVRIFTEISAVVDASNDMLKTQQTEITAQLKVCAKQLTELCKELQAIHRRMNQETAQKVADLKARGLAAGSLAELTLLVQQKTTAATQISKIEQRSPQLEECRTDRSRLREELREIRAERTRRRKSQLKRINENLATTIEDYTIFVKYDDSGVVERFTKFLRAAMHGTYMQDATIDEFCARITPEDLARWVETKDVSAISRTTLLQSTWAAQVVDRLSAWPTLLELQELDKPPKPVIVVKTRTVPPRDIAVRDLSDGQRHTILLTIAILSESAAPLVIDQPEDDLDNAFIFSSVVATLRSVKERRQIILVTHNANIAVLGDSELLLPMKRDGDYGRVIERGSIDRDRTKSLAQDILEGGARAFLRRKELYGH